MTSRSDWLSVQSCPYFLHAIGGTLIKINDFEFAACSLGATECIQKYNTINNKWAKWINVENASERDFDHNICMVFDINQHKLYMHTKNKFIIFNTKQNTQQIYNVLFKPHRHMGYTKSVLVDGKYHVIGGICNKHTIWNEKQDRFDIQHEFNAVTAKTIHALIYLRSKKIILLIGGISDNHITNTIYSFDTIALKWRKLKQTFLVAEIFTYVFIATRNDEYVIFFGGTKKSFDIDNIYILNTNTMKFTESQVKCPRIVPFKAINMNNAKREQLLCFGYIRYLWSMPSFKDIINIPFSLH
eukprot:336297_1